MSFFLRKRKNNNNEGSKQKRYSNNKRVGTGGRRKAADDDEEILSDEIPSSDDEQAQQEGSKKRQKKEETEEESSEDEEENEQEKKLRMAKKYLSELESMRNDIEDDEAGRSVGDMLKDDVLEKAGRLQRKVADKYSLSSQPVILLKNGHRGVVTALCINTEAGLLFTGSKDSCVVKWNLDTGKRICTFYGGLKVGIKNCEDVHCATISALAISSDSKFLASADMKGLINIWNPITCERLKSFKNQYRGPVRALAFRRNFHQLFSAGDDKLVHFWSLDEMAHIEALYGHHSSIVSLDSFVRERAISCGMDFSIRLWKIPESSNLVYTYKNQNKVEIVRLVNDECFVTGFDNGFIAYWKIDRRKPLWLLNVSSGENVPVTAIATLKNTDLIATASALQSTIRLWKLENELKNVVNVAVYNVLGIVNDMEFTTEGKRLVASVGKEHRCGRWWSDKQAKNAVHIIHLDVAERQKANEHQADSEEEESD